MSAIHCPNCQAPLFAKEIAEGWCESCGKKIPAYVLPESAKPTRANRAAPDAIKATGFRARLLRFLDPRSRWALVVIALGMIYWGYREFHVAWDAAADAVDADLAALEQGEEPSQNHVRIGRHLRLYPIAVYSMRKRDERLRDPVIDFSLSPIISFSNPFVADVAALAGKSNEGGDKPGSLPELEKVRVFVQTSRFFRVSAIPKEIAVEDSVTGMFVNRIRPLNAVEARLIQEDHPRINLDRVLILEEDRKPTSPLVALGLVGGGVSLIGLAILCAFLARTGN